MNFEAERRKMPRSKCRECGYRSTATGIKLHERNVHGSEQMRNAYKIALDVVVIELRSKRATLETMLDFADFARVSSIKGRWQAMYDKRIQTTYVGHRSPHPECKLIAMHRLILDAPVGLEVDHIDHNGLNNRRFNLRLATTSLNQLNRKGPTVRNKTSGILGVTFNRDTRKWRAAIRVEGRLNYLGQFITKEAAAAALTSFRKENQLPCQP